MMGVALQPCARSHFHYMFKTDGARPRARFLSVLAVTGLLLAACSSTASPSASAGAGGDCLEAENGVVTLTAENIAFSASCIEVPAGEGFTIEFANNDSAPHDVAIYNDSGKATELFKGDVVEAGQSVTYNVPALDEGEWYFECTIHPNMNGTVNAV